MTLTDEEIENITVVLKHYLLPILRDVTNYEYTIRTREELTVDNRTVYKYTCPLQTIYLDAETEYAVTYDRQKIQDGKYYYKWTDNETLEEDMAYEYVCDYEWKRTTLPHDGGG